MPAAIAAALIAIAPELGATLFTIGGTAITAASALSYAIVTGVTLGAQFGLNRLTSKKGQKSDPSITQFIIKQPSPARTRAYGRCKLGGALFIEIATVAPDMPLTMGIVHCEGPIDAFESWWLNDTLSRNALSDTDLGGQNLALPWAFYAFLESRRGYDFENATVNELISVYGFTGNLYGLAYTVAQFRQPPQPVKQFQYYYPNGAPAVRVIARCALVYDPRDPTQVWTDESTWKWSQNSALIALDYLTFFVIDANGVSIPRGMGLPRDLINLASFSAFADLCDELVETIYAFDGNGNVVAQEGSAPRYRCDGAYSMDEAPIEVLSRILATCDGTLYTLGDGTVGIRGGKWVVPAFTIDDSMIISADVSQGNDKFSAFNQLKISIVAENMDFQLTEGSAWDDEDDQDKNGVLAEDFSLPFVHSYQQGRRLAKIAMAKGNPRWRYNSLICNLNVLNAVDDEFIHVKHSIMGIDDDFIILNFKLIGAAMCELQLASIDASTYDFDPFTEDSPPPAVSIPVSTAQPAPPIFADLMSGDMVSGWVSSSNPSPVIVTLRPGDAVPLSSYQVEHRLSGATPWNLVEFPAVNSSTILSGYSQGDIIEVRARSISTGLVASDWTDVRNYSVGTQGTAGPIISLLALGQVVGLGDVNVLPSVFDGLGNDVDLPSYSVGLGELS